MKAVKIGEDVSLIFTKVIDKIKLGTEEEDSEKEKVNKEYWLKKSSPEILNIVDDIFKITSQIFPKTEVVYQKNRIGIKIDNIYNNFIKIIPKKKFIWIRLKMEKNTEMESESDKSGLIVEEYEPDGKRYWIKLSKTIDQNQSKYLKKYLEISYKDYNSDNFLKNG